MRKINVYKDSSYDWFVTEEYPKPSDAIELTMTDKAARYILTAMTMHRRALEMIERYVDAQKERDE